MANIHYSTLAWRGDSGPFVMLKTSCTPSQMSTDVPEPMQSSQTMVSTVSAPHGPRLILWVWNHGFLIDDCIWECKHCDGDDLQQYKCTCTTHIHNHLSDHLNIIDNTQCDKAVPASINPDEPQLVPIFNRLAPFHVDTFHKHIVNWLLTDHIPFRQSRKERRDRIIDRFSGGHHYPCNAGCR